MTLDKSDDSKTELTHSFLHSRYALSDLLVSCTPTHTTPPSHQLVKVRHSREVLLAHSSVTAIPVQTLDAHRCSLLAWVEPLALTLAVEGRCTWSATTIHVTETSVGMHLPFELLLGFLVPRLFRLVSWGRHLVCDSVAFMSGCVGLYDPNANQVEMM